MNEEELKEGMDKVYAIGFKNGRIDMKNKILKSLNRDWKLFSSFTQVDLLIDILKKIQKLK